MKANEIITYHYRDYYCAIRDNGTGYLCGYVFLPPNHKHIDKEHESDWDVHGGITFTDPILDNRINNPSLGGLWIGFDCAHSGDGQSPEFIIDNPTRVITDGTYKDIQYVRYEIERLVEQLGDTNYKVYDTTLDSFKSSPELVLDLNI